ncbi:growth/differentiation factor 6-A-like [Lethenteron reissneri]|uniref:growth/differentiation factor 6-A-like n=1 Tax=Lethenteron reissneri TaxID=7753 RepID=UPI002AB647C8|nr:growth/differentiation factor 6-A-like [Lethenteron reissneri]XP_061405129.1 growth/differentiation factor 6-A-like [Lethenteron reissneri]
MSPCCARRLLLLLLLLPPLLLLFSARCHCWSRGTVTPHRFMMELLKSPIVAGTNNNNSSWSSSCSNVAVNCNTVSGFVDLGTDSADSPTRQQLLFNVSALPRGDTILAAHLRVLRKRPAPSSSSSSRRPSVSRRAVLQLRPCGSSGPLTATTSTTTTRVVELMTAAGLGTPRWEVFDVLGAMGPAAAAAGGGGPVPTARLLCLELTASSHVDGGTALLPSSEIGLSRARRGAVEKALLVIYSRAERRGNIFSEFAKSSSPSAFSHNSAPSTSLPARFSIANQSPSRDIGRSKRKTGSRRPPAGPTSPAARRKKPTANLARAGARSRAGGAAGSSRCSRRPLRVDFRALGWDGWIIAPLHYEARRCEGPCHLPLPAHVPSTNHAVIQTLLSSLGGRASAPPPPPGCCVPTRLGPAGVLLVADGSGGGGGAGGGGGGNVVYKHYEGMVVEACGCR